jgi:outer membrane protein OmpA-like peptidoglycan-associated protein
MNKTVLLPQSPLSLTLTLALLAATAAAALAQTPALAPPAARIGDAMISADQRGYEQMQSRIKALNDAGLPLRDQHLAQAQCWLDASFHEYTRNDRGPWPQAALDQAGRLVDALAARQAPPAETPLVAGAERIRPDLWARALGLRSHAGWSCAQARAACGEVELVHAGHEQAQLGWRHAKPYVQIAEDLIGDAEALAQACVPRAAAPATASAATTTAATPVPVPATAASTPSTATPATAAAVPPAAALRDPQQVLLFAMVAFRFDGDELGDIAAGGKVSLQALLQRLREERLVVQTVELSGHADRLNGSRRAGYNQALSEKRLRAVRDYLVQQGLAADRISAEAFGDRQPRESCERIRARGIALRDCLLPNRRVEVIVTTRRP